MFRNLRLRRRLAEIGSNVDVQFVVYVNNEQPISFGSRQQCIDYLKNFRSENVIFNLKMYRIETYSL